MVEIILQYFPYNIDYTLYFFCVGLGAFAEPEELDHGLRKDDFTDFEVDLIVFKYVNFVDASFDSNVLEYCDYQVDNLVFLLLGHFEPN